LTQTVVSPFLSLVGGFMGHGCACIDLCFCCDLRFSNPVPRGSKLFYSYMVMTDLEERRVGSELGYRPSSHREF
jgi:hypothetical protein